jgi:hypothetical protein
MQVSETVCRSAFKRIDVRRKSSAHKKGRCKRSGQGKTLDQELQINVSEQWAMSRNLQII